METIVLSPSFSQDDAGLLQIFQFWGLYENEKNSAAMMHGVLALTPELAEPSSYGGMILRSTKSKSSDPPNTNQFGNENQGFP